MPTQSTWVSTIKQQSGPQWHFSSSSSHSLTDLFLHSLDCTLKKHNLPQLEIWWVPGHMNITGNSTPTDQLPASLVWWGTPATLPYSKATLVQAFNTKLKAEIKADFLSTDRGKCLQWQDPSMPSGKFAALIYNLPKWHASTLVQLRTGHIPLNQHLACIQRVDSPACPNCNALHKTVYHSVLICPVYRAVCRVLELKIGRRHSLPHLFHYINSTKRLQQVFRNLTLPTWAHPDPPRVVEPEN